jgi:hypothetical protein
MVLIGDQIGEDAAILLSPVAIGDQIGEDAAILLSPVAPSLPGLWAQTLALALMLTPSVIGVTWKRLPKKVPSLELHRSFRASQIVLCQCSCQ